MLHLGVTLRIERCKRKVFQLLLDLLHPQTMSQRCVDVEGFLRDSLLLLRTTRCKGSHVVQPVGKFDDEHAQIAGHRHQHLAHGGSLLGFLRVELQTIELGDTVDDGGDFVTECLRDVGECQLGVFNGVVQECRNDRGLIQSNVGNDTGHRDRMGDVGLTCRTRLMPVGFT